MQSGLEGVFSRETGHLSKLKGCGSLENCGCTRAGRGIVRGRAKLISRAGLKSARGARRCGGWRIRGSISCQWYSI